MTQNPTLTKEQAFSHVESGQQISNGTFWVWKQRDGLFHCECENGAGCCDDDYDTWDEVWYFLAHSDNVHLCEK